MVRKIKILSLVLVTATFFSALFGGLYSSIYSNELSHLAAGISGMLSEIEVFGFMYPFVYILNLSTIGLFAIAISLYFLLHVILKDRTYFIKVTVAGMLAALYKELAYPFIKLFISEEMLLMSVLLGDFAVSALLVLIAFIITRKSTVEAI